MSSAAQPDPEAPLSRQELVDRAYEELAAVVKQLKAEKKILLRDWEQMAPRERSAQSKIVKDLEDRKRALEAFIEMHPPI